MSSFDKKFFDNLETLPGLIASLGMGIADAQAALDQNYLYTLRELATLFGAKGTDNPAALVAFFQALAPSRYQFTETHVEVRCDLQMAGATETSVGGGLTAGTPMAAVAINASYAKRSAYDYRAAAVIRTTLHAVPADPEVRNAMQAAVREIEGQQLDDNSRYKGLSDAWKDFTDKVPLPTPKLVDKQGGGGGAAGGGA